MLLDGHIVIDSIVSPYSRKNIKVDGLTYAIFQVSIS